MSVDHSRAWQIATATPLDKHHLECSFRTTKGALICDCGILYEHAEFKDKALHSLDGVVISNRKKPNPQSEIRLPNCAGQYNPLADAFSKELEDILSALYRKHSKVLSYDAMTLLACHCATERGVWANLGMIDKGVS